MIFDCAAVTFWRTRTGQARFVDGFEVNDFFDPRAGASLEFLGFAGDREKRAGGLFASDGLSRDLDGVRRFEEVFGDDAGQLDEFVDQILQIFLAATRVWSHVTFLEHVGFEFAEAGFAALDVATDAGVP